MIIQNGKISDSENNPSLSILKAIYPVGSIYLSTVEINPSILFNFGEWE